MDLKMEEFVPISNGDAWDLYTKNLDLVKENEALLLVVEKLGMEVTKARESEAKWIRFYQDQVIDLNKTIDRLNEELSEHNTYEVGCPCCGM